MVDSARVGAAELEISGPPCKMKSSIQRTRLCEKDELQFLAELDVIIKKWASKLDINVDVIKDSVSYLWEDNKRRMDQEHEDFLSTNDMGPYGGR